MRLSPALAFLTILGFALPSLATEGPHVILLSVDTLRADHLGAYGDPRGLTPNIDTLAARGVLFADTITTIGKTGPSFASLFTSLYPPTHGARRNGVALRPDVPTMAELLDAKGYRTAAFISNWTLRRNLAAVHRGFDHWDQEFNHKRYFFGSRERTGRAVNAAAQEWLDANPLKSSERLFLWLHYSEPHSPYDLQKSVDVAKPTEREPGWQKRWRYSTEVAFVDRVLGEALEMLSSRVPLDDALVIFLADHGESLGEHGYWGHGKNTLWPNLDIPLILVGPGLPQGVRVSAPISNVDVLPTLVEMLHLQPPPRMEGRSLLGSWNGSIPMDRIRYAFADRHTALGEDGKESFDSPLEISLQTRGIKTIYDFDSRRPHFFDLASDPLEKHPLKRSPERHDPPFYRVLANWYRELPKYESRSGELSKEDVEQLRSLGYVGGR